MNSSEPNNARNDWPSEDRIVVAIISLLGTFSNSVTLFVLINQFTEVFNRVEACLIANLCVADLLTNISSFVWVFLTFPKHPENLLIAVNCIIWGTVSVSFLTLSLMAFERYLVVVHPAKAQKMLSKQGARASCVIVWLISALCSSMKLVDNFIAQFVMVVMFELSLLLTFTCYARIYIAVRKIMISDQFHTATHYTSGNAQVNMERRQDTAMKLLKVNVQHEARVTRVIFTLIVILVLTVLPYMLLMQITLARELICTPCGLTKAAKKAIKTLFPIEMLNFALNPFIYAWQLPKFRQMCMKTFSRLLSCGNIFKSTPAEVTTIEGVSHSSSFEGLTQTSPIIYTGTP